MFDYQHPTEETVLYYGFRESPGGDEQVLFAGDMEGLERTVDPTALDDAIPSYRSRSPDYRVRFAGPASV